MKIIIIFIGLIVQVNQPMSLANTAVLVAAEHHQPTLVIPFDSIINPDDWVVRQKKGSDAEIDLTGATIRVRGTRGIFSDVKDEFMEGSPSLRSLAPTCKLRPEVRKRQVVPGELAAYVDFRGGRVMPEAYLPKMLSFEGREPRCAICRMRYEADLRGDHVTLVYKKKSLDNNGKEVVETHEIKVAGGRSDAVPEIKVVNRPPHVVARHFDKAYNIYVGKCANHQVRPAVTDLPCTEPKKCGPFPPRADILLADPGDDCTIDHYN